MNKENKVFYCYRQHNCDGEFVVNDKVTVNVIIEADSDQEADSKAQALGITFDSLDSEDYPTRWDSAEGYAALADPAGFIRAADHYDKVNVSVGEAYCHLYQSNGVKYSFVREQ